MRSLEEALIQDDWCLYKRRETGIQGIEPCGNTGRDLIYAAINQKVYLGLPEATRGKEGSSLRELGGSMILRTP